MDSHEVLDIVRLAAGIAILGYGAVEDWRTRRVGNRPWIILAVIGIVLLPVQIVDDGWDREWVVRFLLVLVPIAAILSDVYWDGKEGSMMARYGPPVKYGVAIIAVIALGWKWGEIGYFQHFLAVPVLMLFIVLMYLLDVIRGGADAKALLSLCILFPLYPLLGDLPLLQGSPAAQTLFPFAFVILVNAAIITALSPIYFLAKNVAARELKFPQALLGYKLDSKDLRGRQVWLMESMEDGVHRTFARPRKSETMEKDVQELVKAGHSRVWVTPKIPFIVPMLISIILSATAGNFLQLLLPNL